MNKVKFNFQTSLILFLPFSFYIENTNSTTTCAILENKNADWQLNLVEGGQILSEKFNQIYKSFESTSINFAQTEINCEIRICGFSLSNGVSVEDDMGKCYYFTESVRSVNHIPFGLNYEVTSISCGCKKDSPNCEHYGCQGQIVQIDKCAVLYQETECQDCYHNGISIGEGDIFKTNNSAEILSFKLRKGCEVQLTTFGHLNKTDSEPLVQRWPQQNNLLEPNYHKDGEHFSCKCNALPSTSQTTATTPRTTSDSSVSSSETTESNDPPTTKSSKGGVAVWASISASTILIILIVGLLIGYRFVNKKNSGTQLTIKEIVEDSTLIPSLQTDDSSDELIPPVPIDDRFKIDPRSLSFDRKKELGKGAFGKVFKGLLKSSESEAAIEVAVKVINLWQCSTSEESLKSRYNEIKVAAHLKGHQNVVKFIGYSSVKGELQIIMELCLNKNLELYLKSEKQNFLENRSIINPKEDAVEKGDYVDVENVRYKLQEENPKLFKQLVKFCMEIASGMDHLSKEKVLHIDLAARNILLSMNQSPSREIVAKISDFGMSRKLYDKIDYEKNGMGLLPIKWLALESITMGKYSVKSDVWAYGITIWEIWSLGDIPYENTKLILPFLESDKRLDAPRFATPEIYQKMKSCWDKNPQARPTFKDLQIFFQDLLNTLMSKS